MIEVKNLSVSYSQDEVVSNVNFTFKNQSLIGIIGPNGAGKSTMIKALLNLIEKDSGTILIDGIDIEKAKAKVAYVAQRNNIDWDFPINVFDTVIMGTYPKVGVFKRPGKKENVLVENALKRVSMWEYRNQQIGELSGGQQQRVFLARALVQEADIYFLDEPFVGVDAKSEAAIVQVLKDLRNDGKIVFVVNHDLGKVEDYFDELILMNREVLDIGTVEEVFTYEKMSHAYGSDIAIPRLNEVK
ncbi:MAG: metal ABC transporter ATP-binding protein [Erysipelothrix sp.]|nr:metal ABC transporter ATP-binding protein [Erysipelothrix sp.]